MNTRIPPDNRAIKSHTEDIANSESHGFDSTGDYISEDPDVPFDFRKQEFHLRRSEIERRSEIRTSMVNWAKAFLVFVPLACSVAFFYIACLDLKADVQSRLVDSYLPHVLVVAPIAFIGTILGVALRGSFDQGSRNSVASPQDFVRSIQQSPHSEP